MVGVREGMDETLKADVFVGIGEDNLEITGEPSGSVAGLGLQARRSKGKDMIKVLNHEELFIIVAMTTSPPNASFHPPAGRQGTPQLRPTPPARGG